MKLTNKNIKRINLWSTIIFSSLLSIIVSNIFNIYFYNLSYWLITVPIQLFYSYLNNMFSNFLYKIKENKKLKFKEFVEERKRN